MTASVRYCLRYAKTEMQRLMASLFKRKAKRVDPFCLLD